ncbi:putative proton-dependent oligopeptide transporter family, MFS transporter superfamily [Helianthus debilis subsp. tardiflorus]
MHTVLLCFRLEDKPLFLKVETETQCLADQEPNDVKTAKAVIRLQPIWTAPLMFAVIFQHPATVFIKQGMSMKRNIRHNYKIPPATLQNAITISIVLMPFYDTIFIPFSGGPRNFFLGVRNIFKDFRPLAV